MMVNDMSDNANPAMSSPSSSPSPSQRRATPWQRTAFSHLVPIATRWADNDVYGHVNNVVFYAYFDTIVNQYLIDQGVLDFQSGDAIGLVVETGCQYFASAAFPEKLEGGLRVSRIGNHSVTYEIAIFREQGDVAIAQGHFVHVYVDRLHRRPVVLSDALKIALANIKK